MGDFVVVVVVVKPRPNIQSIRTGEGYGGERMVGRGGGVARNKRKSS